MEIKKFNTYITESLRDKMTGKTLQGVIEDIETKINSKNFEPEEFNINPIIRAISDIYKPDNKELLNLLIDSGAIDAEMVLEQEIDNLQDYIMSTEPDDAAYMINKLLDILKQKI